MVKLLVLAGAKLNAKNREGLTPIDFAAYDSKSWTVLNCASLGDMPEIEEINEVRHLTTLCQSLFRVSKVTFITCMLPRLGNRKQFKICKIMH